MARLDWLIARPVAHRGLHDAQKGVIENTPSAFAAAIAGGYGIECDLQISADGDAMVHHDEVLGRLTDGNGRLDALTAAELKRVPFKATADRMITLAELCDLVDGRAPLLIELKSRFAGDRRLVGRAAEGARGLWRTGGADVVRSRADRGLARDRAALPRGLVAESPHPFRRRERPLAAAKDALGMLRAGPSRAPAVHRIFRQRPARDAADGHAQGSGPPAPDLDRAQQRSAPHRRALCRPDDL